MAAPTRFLVSRYALLLGAVFAGIGVVQPFLPAFLASRGLQPAEVSLALALGSGVRLLAAPTAGRWADRLGDPRLLLGILALAGTLAAGGFLLAAGLLGYLLAQMLFNAAMAPLAPLADTLTLNAARARLLDYGRVRAFGSLAFIVTSALAGWLIGWQGMAVVPLLAAATTLATVLAVLLLPAPDGPQERGRRARGGFRAVLRLPGFPRLLLLSGLIQSSHAAYYGFGSIHWAAAGHSAATIGLLWAEGVIGEILLFFLGRQAMERIGPRGMALLAAGAGLLRWVLMAQTTWLPALAAIQLLHAFTFGAQHLAAMHMIQVLAPPTQAGTAQALHAALGVGLMMGVMTLLSGPLYAAWGGGVFLLMALLCAAALPLALRLGR